MFRTWQKSCAMLMFIERENEASKVDMLWTQGRSLDLFISLRHFLSLCVRKLRVDTAAYFRFKPLLTRVTQSMGVPRRLRELCRPDVKYILIWKWTLSTVLELEEIIAVWSWRELKNKNKTRRRMWIHPIICVADETAGYFGLFLKIWGETKGDFFKII